MNVLGRDYVRDFRILTSFLRVVPEFIIAGEAKCGTTSLFRRLATNKQVIPAKVKEPNNFIEYPKSLAYCRQYYPLAIVRRWREVTRGRRRVTGEASAEYFSRRAVPEVIRALLPSVKIIVLLREPAMRALSDYQMLNAGGALVEEFDDIVNLALELLGNDRYRHFVADACQVEHCALRIVWRGLYLDNLMRWVDVFGRDRICVVLYERLFGTGGEDEYVRVCRFLGIEPEKSGSFGRYKAGRYEVSSFSTSLDRLRLFYREPNERLAAYLGQPLPWNAP